MKGRIAFEWVHYSIHKFIMFKPIELLLVGRIRKILHAAIKTLHAGNYSA